MKILQTFLILIFFLLAVGMAGLSMTRVTPNCRAYLFFESTDSTKYEVHCGKGYRIERIVERDGTLLQSRGMPRDSQAP